MKLYCSSPNCRNECGKKYGPLEDWTNPGYEQVLTYTPLCDHEGNKIDWEISNVKIQVDIPEEKQMTPLEIKIYFWPKTPQLREVKFFIDGEEIGSSFMNSEEMGNVGKQFIETANQLIFESNSMGSDNFPGAGIVIVGAPGGGGGSGTVGPAEGTVIVGGPGGGAAYETVIDYKESKR
jgi:hypothetical protein